MIATVSNSSLPAHIRKLVSKRPETGILAQVEVGPKSPIAGPTFPKDETTKEKMLSNDSSGIIRDKNTLDTRTKPIQIINIPTTILIASGATTSLFIRIAITFLGLANCCNSLEAYLVAICPLKIFNPPDVEPAQAPNTNNISKMN